MARESVLLRDILAALGALPGVILFRNHVGRAWQGSAKHVKAGQLYRIPADGVYIPHARPCAVGLAPETPDIVGMRSVTITPDMVGRTIAVFAGVEVKTEDGRIQAGQAHCIAVFSRMGARVGIARDIETARAILDGAQGDGMDDDSGDC